ncbi:LOW QUALITY PROTEIN: hypothetical protein OSB04_un000946 [Centaurea solstitialis]|uniref:Reverse transcriptase domain-containing protein n=1 Tax=Centaurea solstitialis TaxID=347529 RepID=A0AA38S436_9ASTR|nr:LOW QUALITY PROTEIN: hypothetical protein OSB04_un000946 [Centaurea solstitialis]
MGGLIELRNGGRKFSRYSKDGSKLSLLDRFLVTNNFFCKWSHSFVTILPRGLSDHCPLIMDTVAINFGPTYFKFFNSWLLNSSLEKVVKECWQSVSIPAYTPPIQRFMLKLRLLKKKIREWRKSEFDQICRNKKIWADKSANLDLKAESGSLSFEERKERMEIDLKLFELEKAEALDLKQKARTRWAVDGDDNSKLFHGFINHNKRKNFVHGISVNGVWLALRKGRLKKRFGGCDGEKAPGPDGFSFKFLKSFWDTIKVDLIDAVNAFEHGGELTSGSNSSFVCLIPKIVSPVSLVDYRPISLIGCLYKVISKVLANRLKTVISSVVSNVQTAFISGRSILDGPLIVSEVMAWAKKSQETADGAKNFDKAFDSIRNCLNSSSISILLNGSPTKEFKPQIGVRQGDPLAPFLFILAAEGLHVAMLEALEKGVFKGVQLPNGGPTVSHLQYADDAIFLGDWSRSNIRNLIRVLRCFHLSSGLRVNWTKSNLIGVGVETHEIAATANSINCKVGSLPLFYLGLPI